MQPLKITLKVDPATAVRAGRTTVGEHVLTLTETDLAEFSADEREALARHLAKKEQLWAMPLNEHADPISDATVETLRGLLRRRAEYVAEEEARIKAETQREADRVAWLYHERCSLLRSGPIEDLFTVAWGVARPRTIAGCTDLPPAELPEPHSSAYVVLGRIQEGETYMASVAAEHERQKAEQAAAEATRQVRTAAEMAALTDFMRTHAPEDFQRFSAGWMDPRQVHDIIRLFALDPLAGAAFAPARSLVAESERMTFRAADAMSRDEYAAWVDLVERASRGIEICGVMFDCEAQPIYVSYWRAARLDEADEADDDGEIETHSRWGVHLTIKIGTYTASRPYILRDG